MTEPRTHTRCSHALPALALALALGALAWSAPVPPPRPPRPTPPPVVHDECIGSWQLPSGAGGSWWITLYPNGLYRCHADKDSHDKGLSSYVGEWRLRDGELQVAERSFCAAPEQSFTQHGGTVSREGRNLKVGGHSWMAGRWIRR